MTQARQLEREADQILRSAEARRLKARIEAASFTEADGRRMYDRIGREWQTALEASSASSHDQGEVVGFQMGCWAGRDRVKQYAIEMARGHSCESVRHFAAAHRVSESLVHRRIRQARRFIGSLCRPA